MSNAVTTKPGTEVAGISSGRFAALAQQAKDAAAKERPSVSKISLKAGVISYGGNSVKDNRLDVVVLAAVYRNTFYSGRYDSNNIVNPDCFSLAETDEGMEPYNAVHKPEHATCEGCPRAQWGSDLNGGRGKACKQTRRLVLLPASALASEDDVLSGEMAVLDIPVTSVKNYANYVNVLAASIGLPPHAAVTEISTKPDAKTQFKVEFKGIKAVPSDALLDAIEKRRAEATRIGLLGYESSNDAEEALPAAADKGTPVKKAVKKF